MKKATTVEEQMEKMNGRGMTLDVSVEKAKEVLSDIGYFRLGFYCFPFEVDYPRLKNRTHLYKDESKISDAVALYYFDVDLRNILSKYINRIEINFRTKVISHVSIRYLESSTWFVDPAVMERKYIDHFDAKIYTDSFKKNPVIRRHHKEYINDKYAPAWKTLDFMTFGGVLVTYKNLKDPQLKQQIAAQYGIRNVNIMENYMQSIVEIRNVCAHGGVLFDHIWGQALKNGPALEINNDNKDKLYSLIRLILFVLSSISQNRANEMRAEVEQLFNKFRNDASISWIIEKCVGFKHF
jgi:abortive infection bacteriophage resistance protein